MANSNNTTNNNSSRTVENACTHLFISSVIILTISFITNFYFQYQETQSFQEVHDWLSFHGLEKFSQVFKDYGVTSLLQASLLTKMDVVLALKQSWLFASLTSNINDVDLLYDLITKLKHRLQFRYWLYANKLKHIESEFNKLNLYTLKDLIDNVETVKHLSILSDSFKSVTILENNPGIIDHYPVSEERSFIELFLCLFWSWLVFGAKAICVITVLLVVGCSLLIVGIILFFRNGLFRVRPQTNTGFSRFQQPNVCSRRDESNCGFFSRLFGNFFDIKKCAVEWSICDIVGNEVVLTVKFFKNNGRPYGAKSLQSLKCEVLNNNTLIESTIKYTGDDGFETVSIHFLPVKAAMYHVSILANGKLVNNAVYEKYFKAGPIDVLKSSLVVPSSLLVLEEGKQELLTFDEQDKYGNPSILKVEELYKYHFEIFEANTSKKQITPHLSFLALDGSKNKAWLVLDDPGVYIANVYYDEKILSDNIVILVLTDDEMKEVNKNISFTSWSLWYEAYLYIDQDRTKATAQIDHQLTNQRRRSLASAPTLQGTRKKKVYCYLSPKFLTIKEYYLKLFPKKLYTLRIKPTVKISLSTGGEEEESKLFKLEAPNGVRLDFYCQQRNVFVATFIRLLLKNIGGSECFVNKKEYFYRELNRMYLHKTSTRLHIKVKRNDILTDTWSSVKLLSQSDWWKQLYITFLGEEGLDCGGLTREWVSLLVNKLFNMPGGLFRRFNQENPQALIHPNPFRIETYQKLKYFELAGLVVGKCLVECSCGGTRQQFVKARFSRSFLSVLLGVGVSWKHFESDDKEYFTGKIKYILENDPKYLDLTFTEDVYDHENKLVKTIELIPNGCKIDVCEQNKHEYIQRVAEYRLYESVKDEFSAFLKGLHYIVPEGLLSIFDENELELLICGMGSISVADMKTNHVQAGSSPEFQKVIVWFWSVISSFGQEELSRLLQFITGCSQLPPNGFKELVPKLQITPAAGTNTLPTAHTCFNNLCLPNYTGYEELMNKLLLAITEGSEGFGMA